MNKLNQHIKNSIIRYHSIFPNRECVLEHLFLTIGNGMEWYKDSDGKYVLGDVFDKGEDIPTEIPHEVSDNDYSALRIELSNVLIDFTNKHLDDVAEGNVGHDQGLGRKPNRYPFSGLNRMVIALNDITPDEMDDDWRNGLVYYAKDVMRDIRSENRQIGEEIDTSVIPKSDAGHFKTTKAVVEKFKTVRMVENDRRCSEMIDEILAEKE